ncbi:MAG: tryptophan-rich sensory protein [Candidatus ainarchaeum sp.]|nr:tryptophan-rich sensory protein [Candidatus ainarchaeum sp.]
MKILKLLGLIILCELMGAIGSIFTVPNIAGWYSFLNKPFFTPPSWLFAPAWTVLFALMGIALYFVLENGLEKKETRIAAGIFAFQFLLNIFWSALFFGLKNPLLGFIEIIALWLAILAAIISFHRVSKKAAWLLLPYICWASFAAALNFSVWMLNA